MARISRELTSLPKAPTGIEGFDEITFGGLPQGRPTLVCGGAGCGKTLFGIEFLVRGATKFGEPGVCVTFEESADDLIKNVASLGFDLNRLQRAKKLLIDCVYIERNQIEETGEYDLEGLFIRLASAIDSIGARRVLLDTPEALFAGLSNMGILRSEMRRLFAWLKQKGVTAVITGERGEGMLTRHGLEEYVSDCVILLDQRVQDDAVTRRLRVLKYRGSTHGTNEYPFLIDRKGISVLPVTSIGLNHKASGQRIASGVAELDAMLGGKGYFRGSSVLVTGTAGTGKTSLAAHFTEAACRRGERAIYFAFEESPEQIARNMRSIGIELSKWIRKGLLHIEAVRPSSFGMEMHLVRMHAMLHEHNPDVVVMDPISAMIPSGSLHEVGSLVLRIVDFIKARGATGFFTAVTADGDLASTDLSISSLVDTWLLLQNVESNGERNRVMYVLKSRGMAHSNQIREFMLTNRGVKLRPVYLGSGGVLTGSARVAREAEDRREEIARRRDERKRELSLRASMAAVNAKLAALELERNRYKRELEAVAEEGSAQQKAVLSDQDELRASRGIAVNGRVKEQEPNGPKGVS